MEDKETAPQQAKQAVVDTAHYTEVKASQGGEKTKGIVSSEARGPEAFWKW
jgi:hypothetical protein